MAVHIHSSFHQANTALARDRVQACDRIVEIIGRRRDVEREALFAHSRSRAPVAAARQMAMYLCHVLLEISMTDVGRYFGRDRTTVAHACAVVEDLRDDPAIEREIASLEQAIFGFEMIRHDARRAHTYWESVYGH